MQRGKPGPNIASPFVAYDLPPSWSDDDDSIALMPSHEMK
jgi:hypothetical protein